jgi:diacylglycerol kinase (ATP)
VTGARHILAAAGYSLAGLRRLWAESAFRQELIGGAAILGVMAWLGKPAIDFVCFAVLFLILLAVESLNTAIESMVDHLSPEWQAFARDAKDLGSFAVMCLLIAHGLFLGYVILS